MNPPKTVAARLGEMLNWYKKCLRLTQQTLIEPSQLDEGQLAELLRQRSRIYLKIKNFEAGLPTETREGRVFLSGLAESEIPQVEAILGDLRATLEDLSRADRQLQDRMKHVLSHIEKKLGRVKQGQTMLKAYAPFRGGVAYYVDRRD